ncbi:LacI family DNA-binding transcriptional regulator [Alteraurantiacibacter buctensis]|nr:LacI family DNA-binding transcriptional regulator [Alteraurantiacibacter buctensis]
MSGAERQATVRATIVDVARAAGVSTATVSRFLNGSATLAPATAERVRGAIASLGYIPNIFAGSLASRSSKVVAVVVPGIVNSIIDKTVEQLVMRLSAAGVVPLLGITHLDPERLHSITMAALGMQAEAIIFTNQIPPDLRDLLARFDTTVIEIWGLPREPLDVAIGFSHREVGFALADYAARQGYRRPHLVTAQSPRGQIRSDAFAERWAQNGGAVVTEQTVAIPLVYDHAGEVMAAIGSAAERPDLIVVASDLLAYELVRQLQAGGLRVPQDVAVIGFGDMAMPSAEPQLTTVRIDGTDIADRVLDVLTLRGQGEDLPERRINCGFTIVPRGSA